MKRKRTKKKPTNKKKRGRPKKVIRRIGVFIPLQADIEAQKVKLDKYIVEQGCQRLSPIYKDIDEDKGIIELYARVHYISRSKAEKTKPITKKSLSIELNQLAKKDLRKE